MHGRGSAILLKYQAAHKPRAERLSTRRRRAARRNRNFHKLQLRVFCLMNHGSSHFLPCARPYAKRVATSRRAHFGAINAACP